MDKQAAISKIVEKYGPNFAFTNAPRTCMAYLELACSEVWDAALEEAAILIEEQKVCFPPDNQVRRLADVYPSIAISLRNLAK